MSQSTSSNSVASSATVAPSSASEAGSAHQQQAPPVRRHHRLKWLRQATVSEIALLLLIVIAPAVFGWMVYDSRLSTQLAAEKASSTIVDALASSIQQNFDNIQFSLNSAVAGLALPGIWEVSPQIRRAALFEASMPVKEISATTIIDRKGGLVASTTDSLPAINFADRDYFKFHQSHTGLASHFTGPIFSRVSGRSVLAVSRRLNDADGNFAGVVASGVFLSYFQELFERLNPGETGTVGLFSTEGVRLMRVPFRAQAIGMDVTQGPLFRHMQEATSGIYTDRASFDGVERLVVFRKIADLPFVVTYARNTSFVFQAWRRLAWIVVAIAGFLLTAKLTLLWHLRQERARRLTAERVAGESVAALSAAKEHLEERVRYEVLAREEAYEKLTRGQRMEAIGQLAGGIAHDINNVLQAVTGASGLLQYRTDRPAEIMRLSSMALSAADRGSSITRRLLAFARQDKLRAESIDPAELLTDLKELLDHTLGAGAVVKLQLAGELPKLVADRLQLQTVLINLATNARDATPSGNKPITISASFAPVGGGEIRPDGVPAGDYIRISVRDSGIGMDPQTLARAVEPFYTTKGVGKGTGLGLSMAKGFAEQSGGGLDITSQLGVGTTVTVWLPILNLQSTALAAKPDSTRVDITPAAGRSVAVLLVDDEEMILVLLSDWLTSKGFVVTTAASAEAALALLRDGLPVDLLLTDLSMPDVDGIDLVRAAQEARGNLPAILLTGNIGAARMAVEGLVGSNFTVLHKPVHLDALPNEIMMAIDKAKAGLTFEVPSI